MSRTPGCYTRTPLFKSGWPPGPLPSNLPYSMTQCLLTTSLGIVTPSNLIRTPMPSGQ